MGVAKGDPVYSSSGKMGGPTVTPDGKVIVLDVDEEGYPTTRILYPDPDGIWSETDIK